MNTEEAMVYALTGGKRVTVADLTLPQMLAFLGATGAKGDAVIVSRASGIAERSVRRWLNSGGTPNAASERKIRAAVSRRLGDDSAVRALDKDARRKLIPRGFRTRIKGAGTQDLRVSGVFYGAGSDAKTSRQRSFDLEPTNASVRRFVTEFENGTSGAGERFLSAALDSYLLDGRLTAESIDSASFE